MVSLLIGLCFVVMSISGLLLYFGQKQWHPVETLHILFGVIFLAFAIFHINNNWKSIQAYSKTKVERQWTKELVVGLAIVGVFLVGGSLEIPPFKQMAHGLKGMFGAKRGNRKPPKDGKSATAVDLMKDSIAILGLLHDFDQSLRLSDTVMAHKIWADEKELSFIQNGNRFIGWANIKQALYSSNQQQPSTIVLAKPDVTMHLLGDGVWVERWGIPEVGGINPAPSAKIRETLLLKRVSNQWRLVHVHTSV